MSDWIDKLWTLRKMPLIETDAAADRRLESWELNTGRATVDDLHPGIPPAVILPEDATVLSFRAFVAENIPHLHRG